MNQPSQHAVECAGSLGLDVRRYSLKQTAAAIQEAIDKATEELQAKLNSITPLTNGDIRMVIKLTEEVKELKERAIKAEASNDSLLKIAEELAFRLSIFKRMLAPTDSVEWNQHDERAISTFNKWKEGRK